MDAVEKARVKTVDRFTRPSRHGVRALRRLPQVRSARMASTISSRIFGWVTIVASESTNAHVSEPVPSHTAAKLRCHGRGVGIRTGTLAAPPHEEPGAPPQIGEAGHRIAPTEDSVSLAPAHRSPPGPQGELPAAPVVQRRLEVAPQADPPHARVLLHRPARR